MAERAIKVLIVEDSLVNQKLLSSMISHDIRFELVGIANNGLQAIEYVKKFRPDVVSMDIQMPLMDGVKATTHLMKENPLPIVIVSSYYTSSDVEIAMKVLEAGAVTILPKPFGLGHPKYAQTARQYLNMLYAMSEIKVVRRKSNITAHQLPSINQFEKPECKPGTCEVKIVVIGASAGGPEGLRVILSGLPSNFPIPILIVQHIDSNFAGGFCDWLNTFSQLPVHIAKEEENMKPGHVYLPPGNRHLIVKSKGIMGITNELPVKGLRPSVSYLFHSVAQIYRENTLAILLSGMGKDGAIELKMLRDLGAYTMVQSEQSCLVFGMPGEAVKLGAANAILSPIEMIKVINELIKK